MKKESTITGIGFFEKYLTVWVILCMVAGVFIGRFLPIIPETLGRFEYARVSIPIAILIWLMIYPMMLRVDFHSVKMVGKNPKGLFVTWVTNWLIKPFTMFGIAWFFSLWFLKALFRPIWQGIISQAPFFWVPLPAPPWCLCGAT
jgi:ACR3 family arsenite transporter